MSDYPSTRGNIVTPCTNVCTMGPDNYCIGCKRTRLEIASWRRLSQAERKVIMDQLPTR